MLSKLVSSVDAWSSQQGKDAAERPVMEWVETVMSYDMCVLLS